MKKTFTLLTLFVLMTFIVKAQNDTFLYENFDVDSTANYATFNSGNDTIWVNFDVDGLFDANGRPPNWYWSLGAFGTNDTTGCVLSSSWFATPGQCLNYLITPPIQIVDASAVLSWKSAPRQTPLYLDGYKILVSTTDNYETSFTDTIFIAAEYVSGSSSNGGNFSLYTFSPGFIHGEDGTYIEYDGDSARFVGTLRPFNVSLAAYSGQTIYIAFLHDAFDDNIMALDDVLITGTLPVGISQFNSETISLNLLPNPANDKIKLNYYLTQTSHIYFNIYDSNGRLVKQSAENLKPAGIHNTIINIDNLSPGVYSLMLINGNKYAYANFVINR